MKKTYYSTTPGSTYIDKAGDRHIFMGGQLTTEDPAVQADLDKQIANGNSVIRAYKESVPDVAAEIVAASISQNAEVAAKLLAMKEAKEVKNTK